MARIPGTFDFSANLEVNKLGPLDARITVESKSELTGLPFAYIGMVVSVTSDTTPANNGVYVLNDTNAADVNNWTLLAEGASLPTGGTTGQVLSKTDATDYNVEWIDGPADGAKGEKGDQGDTGLKGDQGDTGLKGDIGDQGVDGSNSIIWQVGFSGNAAFFSPNSGTNSSVTQLTLNDTATSSIDAFSWLDSIKVGDTISMYKKTDPAEFGIYEVTSISTGSGTHIFGVSVVSANGSSSLNQQFAVSYTVNGVDGIQGAKGDKGDTGLDSTVPGPDGAKGDQGDKGDTGEGVIAGGTTGQILSKSTNADYATTWIDGATGGATKYLLRLEYDVNEALINSSGSFVSSGGFSAGASISSYTIGSGASGHFVSLSFANESNPPLAIFAYGWQPVDGSYKVIHFDNDDTSQIKYNTSIADFTEQSTNEGGSGNASQWAASTNLLFTGGFGNYTITIPVEQSILKYGDAISGGFGSPSKYPHVYILFIF